MVLGLSIALAVACAALAWCAALTIALYAGRKSDRQDIERLSEAVLALSGRSSKRPTLPASAAPVDVRDALLAAHVDAAAPASGEAAGGSQASAPSTTPKASRSRVTEQGKAAGLTRPEPWADIAPETDDEKTRPRSDRTWPAGAGPAPRRSAPSALPKAPATLDIPADLDAGNTNEDERRSMLLPVFREEQDAGGDVFPPIGRHGDEEEMRERRRWERPKTLADIAAEEERAKQEARTRMEHELGPEPDDDDTMLYTRPPKSPPPSPPR